MISDSSSTTPRTIATATAKSDCLSRKQENHWKLKVLRAVLVFTKLLPTLLRSLISLARRIDYDARDMEKYILVQANFVNFKMREEKLGLKKKKEMWGKLSIKKENPKD